MHSNLLKDKVALITGGAGGIGFAVASAYCQNGASVVLTDFNENKLLEAKKELQGPVLPLALDVTNEDQTLSVIDCAIEKFGKIDIVVPNAGILHLANFLDTETKDFKNLIETNLVGAFITAQSSSPVNCAKSWWQYNLYFIFIWLNRRERKTPLTLLLNSV